MGIKRAIATCVVSLVTGAAALHAQDSSDEVATQRHPEDRADRKHPADPSDMDVSLVDRDYVQEPTDDDDQIRDSEHVVRNPTLKKPRLGAGAVKNDSEDMVDDAENDPRDHGRTPDRRAKKDPPKDEAKKDSAKKEAPKADADKKTGPAKDLKKRPAGCVDVSGQARFASVGYDHIVTLKSDCKKTVKCQVRTNVNPEPASVELAPAAEERVVTWRGSPAREFQPDVTCK